MWEAHGPRRAARAGVARICLFTACNRRWVGQHTAPPCFPRLPAFSAHIWCVGMVWGCLAGAESSATWPCTQTDLLHAEKRNSRFSACNTPSNAQVPTDNPLAAQIKPTMPSLHRSCGAQGTAGAGSVRRFGYVLGVACLLTFWLYVTFWQRIQRLCDAEIDAAAALPLAGPGAPRPDAWIASKLLRAGRPG